MNWKTRQYSDDYEEELQVDPDYKPKKPKQTKVTPDVQQVFDLFDNPAKKVWHMRPLQRDAAQVLFDSFGMETLKKRMKRISNEQENNDPYFPHVSCPQELLEKMPKIERYLGI